VLYFEKEEKDMLLIQELTGRLPTGIIIHTTTAKLHKSSDIH
jgi:hypothetical protein